MSPALQNTIASTGSLQAAIAQLWNDSCAAPWESPVHALLKEALAEQSRRKSAEREAA